MKIMLIILCLFATLTLCQTPEVILPEVVETPESIILVVNDDMEFHFTVNEDGSLVIVKVCLHDVDHQMRVFPIMGNKIILE